LLGTPRTLLSSPERVQFGLPNLIGSSVKTWDKLGVSDDNPMVPLHKLLPDPSIMPFVTFSTCFTLRANQSCNQKSPNTQSKNLMSFVHQKKQLQQKI